MSAHRHRILKAILMQNRLPSNGLSSLVLCFAVMYGTIQADEPPVTLRVLTYNIHHGEGVDGKLDLKRIAQVITACEPDLVALQEVDREVRRSGSQQQPEVLAQLTGLQQAFGKNLEIQGGGYGNCVLSRFPISSARNHSLPNIVTGEPRGLLEVTITVPDLPDQLRFLATHFDHRPDETNRLASVKWIEDFCGNSRKPLLMAGDLNCTPESETSQTTRTAVVVCDGLPPADLSGTAPPAADRLYHGRPGGILEDCRDSRGGRTDRLRPSSTADRAGMGFFAERRRSQNPVAMLADAGEFKH